MYYLKTFTSAAATAALCFFAIAAPALAVTNTNGLATETPYVAAFDSAFGPSSVPYAGTMDLIVRNGTLSGTYTGISSRPDPLYGQIAPIIGTIDPDDGHVQFTIGNRLSFQGTMYSDGVISGTASYQGALYDFMAKPGAPGRSK